MRSRKVVLIIELPSRKTFVTCSAGGFIVGYLGTTLYKKFTR